MKMRDIIDTVAAFGSSRRPSVTDADSHLPHGQQDASLTKMTEARKFATLAANGEIIDYYADSAVVLYHGTSATRAKAMSGVLEPRVGDFTRNVYPRAKMSPLVFAADDMFKSKVFSAARFAVAFELGMVEDRRMMTIEQFVTHAAVIKIETDRGKFRQVTRTDKPQRGAEKFDYISYEPVKIDDIYMGRNQITDFFGEIFLISNLIYQ